MTFIHVSSTGHYSHDSVSTRPPAVALESLSHSSHWCSARLLTSLSSAPQLCSLKAQSSICKLCLSARLRLLQCHNRPRQRFRWRTTERIHHLLVRHVSRTCCERAPPSGALMLALVPEAPLPPKPFSVSQSGIWTDES